MSYRLGVLTTHPIQYYSAWFRHLASRLDLEVFYAHRQDGRGQADAGFGVEFAWDTPLLEGYPFRWLNNVASQPGLGRFGGCDTPEIANLVAQRRLDAMLVIGWNYKSALQGIWACRSSNVPVLMRGDSQLPTRRPLWKRAGKFLPYRLLLPRLDAHLFVGKRNRDYLVHYGVPQRRLFFCPHCVDNQYFAKQAAQAEASGACRKIREEMGIPQDAFVSLFAGKLIPSKRPEDLVRACLKLSRSGDGKLWLMLVGSGPLEPALRRLAGESTRIVFAGFQNQSRMPAFYRAADVLVLPSGSETETWGLVVNEAMATGLPAIVADRVGCAPDLIEERVTGWTYSAGDIDQLAARLLAARQQFKRGPGVDLARRAVLRKIEGYSFEAATQGLLQALDRVVERTQRRATKPARLSAAAAPDAASMGRKETSSPRLPALVLGMGAFAYGKEKRAVTAFRHMDSIRPFFLISKWEDGSVSRLLGRYGLEFDYAGLGYLGRSKPIWTLVNLAHLPLQFLKVIRTYLREKCRLIVLLSLRDSLNVLIPVTLLKIFAGARLVLYYGDIPSQTAVDRLLGRIFNRLGDGFVANSEAVRRGMSEACFSPDKVEVIYNGVRPEDYSTAPPLDFRSRFGWAPETLLVAYAGQFSAPKGVEDFVRAARLVVQQNPRCRFLLIGRLNSENPFHRALLASLEDNGLADLAKPTGWIEEMANAYAGVDIVVVPSRHPDPAPNVNLEAMAAGVPVVATRVGGNPELIIDGETGFLTPGANPERLAEQILRLASDQELRVQMGQAGGQLVRKRFDSRNNARRLEKILVETAADQA